jgi:hypothetical protein
MHDEGWSFRESGYIFRVCLKYEWMSGDAVLVLDDDAERRKRED